MDDYRSLIGEFQDHGYTPCRLQDVRADQPDLYLRHDVDLSLELAVEMAAVEAELGVFSTYFVLVSTDIYNPATIQNRRILSSIIERGHEIGLHFDVTRVEDGDIDSAAERECAILSSLTGHPVETISFHRPARNLLNSTGRFAGRRHTYEPEFFSNIAYISDSNGGWHHGHPLDHPAIAARTAVQLLTHPIWWGGWGTRETVPLIREFVKGYNRRSDDAIAGTITAYAQWRATEEKAGAK
ncbi:hypothetical protein [Sphingomonas hankookensis]|uniref:hypothetical protein n=1 Tax=Sphingomonas hankookensis TaxID=563996 RepID=UPI00234EAF7A|nr:hypothetical protein [Sphingomonas hankookensis]WCP73957.1 hypothetical protein PPZ50_17980 [Sphingomonas hankookensis]